LMIDDDGRQTLYNSTMKMKTTKLQKAIPNVTNSILKLAK